MNLSFATLLILAVFTTAVVGFADAPSPALQFPDASAFPERTALPDPMLMFDGRRVESGLQWKEKRRPELQALFQHYMYGTIPPRPTNPRFTKVAEYSDFLEGKATLRLVTVDTGGKGSPQIDLMMVLPNERRAAVPVFLAMNFCGNQGLTTDPRVPLAKGWVYKDAKGTVKNKATDASRGSDLSYWPGHEWPIAEIIGRGYALASFYSGDIDSDRSDVSDGIYAWLAAGDPTKNSPTNRGSIAAWAWGFHRCVDYLLTDRDIDSHRVIALGHSRQGKAALLAGAFDERIALVIAHQAGCGGSAPSRGKVGESLKRINTSFPHWFNAEFKEFNAAPERLPFDQHCLVALCAPRPVLFSNAQEDQWANPAGQFEVLLAADPVYRFLIGQGLLANQMPPQGKLVNSRLGYYIREGRHSMTRGDWQVFLSYVDYQLR